MKWLGQSIIDFIARFRSDVYLDSPTAGGSDPDKFLGIDTDNKIIYRTGAEVFSDIGAAAGDITGIDITGGTNLTVASESGTTSGDYSCTLNVDDAFLINNGSDTTTGTITAGGFTTTGTWTFDTSAGGTAGVTNINVGSTFTDDDVTIMSAGAIKEKIEAYGYSTTTGDITGVTLTTDDSEVISDIAGSADFIIAGGTDIDTTSEDTTVTISLSANRNRTFTKTGNTDGTYSGDVVYFGGTTSMTVGTIYHYKSDGTWEVANANAVATCDGLLGVALGAASDTNGMLLRGMVTLDHDPGAVGDVLFLSAASNGDATATAPSGSSDIVRVIGYCLDASNGQIWFDPDKTYVEVA